MDIIFLSILSGIPFIIIGISILIFSYKFYSKKLKTKKGYKIYRIYSGVIASLNIFGAIAWMLSPELIKDMSMEEILVFSIGLSGAGVIGGFIWSGIWFIIFRLFEKVIAKK